MSVGRKLEGDIAELHRKTSLLMATADKMGDEFLRYLYSLALRHIEEKAGIAHNQHGDELEQLDEPAIQKLADRLKKIRCRKI